MEYDNSQEVGVFTRTLPKETKTLVCDKCTALSGKWTEWKSVVVRIARDATLGNFVTLCEVCHFPFSFKHSQHTQENGLPLSAISEGVHIIWYSKCFV